MTQKYVENPMVAWTEPKVVGECAGCGGDIIRGEDVYDSHLGLIHSRPECCMDFIANSSLCRVAGE